MPDATSSRNSASRRLIDTLLLMERFASDMDWDEIEALAEKGGFLKPLGCFLALVTRLGVSPHRLPKHLIPHYLLPHSRGLAAAEFERLMDDFATMFETPPSTFTRLRREILLTAQWRTIGWKNMRRLRGLVTAGNLLKEPL